MEARMLGFLSIILFWSCGSDDPVSETKEQRLVGTWELEATRDIGGEDAYELSYTFWDNGDVRNRVGGPFLAQLRELEAIPEEDLGQLAEIDELDGGNLNWLGTWSTNGDSLIVEFDRVSVEVYGSVPLVGRLAVPVVEQAIEPSEQTAIGFACELGDTKLLLQGNSVTVGMVAGSSSSKPTDFGEPLDQIVDLAMAYIVPQLTVQAQGINNFSFVRK